MNTTQETWGNAFSEEQVFTTIDSWIAAPSSTKENIEPPAAELPPLNYETLGNTLTNLDWSSLALSKIQRGCPQHKVHPQSLVDSVLSQHQISVSEPGLGPILSFEDASFPEKILAEFTAASFTAPTPIQSFVWPAALQGRDVIAVACTGSGKTLSYLIPAFSHILAQEVQKRPLALVLSPTRELAKQITFESRKFAKALGLEIVCLYGGNGRQFQLKDLEVSPSIIVATPGRLLDFLENQLLSLKDIGFVVVDEADNLLGLGFEAQLRKILSQIRPDRQTLMCSAAWPEALKDIAAEFMKDPVLLNVGSRSISCSANITQEVSVLESSEKLPKLLEILKGVGKKRVLVFVDTKAECGELLACLEGHGITAKILNGDMPMKERMGSLLEFRAGRTLVLIATDLASRGIDIKDLEHVVVYDFPRRIADYVYRIGRTGRAHNKGTAHVLFTADNARQAQDFIDLLRDAKQKVPRELIKCVQKKKELGGEPRKQEKDPRKRFRSRSPRTSN